MNAIKLTGPEIQQNLDLVEGAVLQNRKELAARVEARILERGEEHPESGFLVSDPFYLDDLYLGDIHPKARNIIGPVCRKLMREGKLRQTGTFKRSSRPESNGRVLFQYVLL